MTGFNELVANTETGKALIDYFSNDQNNIGIATNEIADKKGNYIDLGEQGYPTIYMKSDLSESSIPTENGLQISPFWLILGHELDH